MNKIKTLTKSLLAITVLMYLILLFIYSIWDYSYRKKNILKNIDSKLYNSAASLKYILPDDFHDRAIDGQAIPIGEDKYIANKLTKFVKETNFKYMYTIVKKGNRLYFAACDLVADPGTKRGTFYFYPYDEADESFIKAFEQNTPTYKNVTDQWGTVRTIMVPEKSPGGITYLACADYDISYVNGLLQKNLLRSIAIILFFLLLPTPILLVYKKSINEFLEKLSESEEKYRLLADNIIDNIWVVDLSTLKFTYLSPSIIGITGYSPDDLMGLHIQDVLTPPSMDLATNLLSEALAEENRNPDPSRSWNLELEQYHKDGTTVWTEASVRFIRDKEGLLTSLLGVTRDITDRKKEEEKRQITEERNRLILENAHDAILVAQDGIIKYANPSTETMMGYSNEELARISFIEIIHPDDRKRMLDRYHKEIEGHKIPGYYTYRAEGKNHREILLEINTVKIEWEKKPALLCFVRDTTEAKRIEKQLMQTQKMEAIGTLAGGIAHDFNNILGAILGYAQLAQLNSSENPKVQKYIDQLCLASDRAKGLVQQILTFSRQSKSEKIPVDIGLIVKEALKLIRASIPSTIEIRQNVKPNLGTIEADQTQIHQIVMNLCTNAFHAMEEDGGNLRVDLVPITIGINETSAYNDIKSGPYLKLSVTDTGHGMSADTLSRIFEPYFTTKEEGKGTGIGLATVHGIVKNHGGGIEVHSKPGEGTTFQILFPVIKTKVEKAKKTPNSLPAGTEQILFVDDEKYIIDIGKELLESLGYQVETRVSAHDALEAFRIRPNKYDIVITDMTMPKMTGEQLASEIMKIRQDIPIILCTGYSSRITSEDAIEMGIGSILMKPFTLNDLAKTVRNVLDKKP